jgi:GTP cyclohydrolase II
MTAGSPAKGDAKAAARAIDALRRGWAVRVIGADGMLTLRAIERVGDPSQFAAAHEILLSGNRAATLCLMGQGAAAAAPYAVRIAAPQELAGPDGAALAMALADPVLDLSRPLKGPFRALPLCATHAASAAMELARMGGMLPAFLIVDDTADAQTSAADVAAFADAGTLNIAARARLPVAGAEDAQIVAFRSAADATDHVALIIGQRDETPPLVRIHSECLTGDVLGSLKCDCGPQLHAAIHAMSGAPEGKGWGVLLYLRQEGRGIGLINKLRAYALQDQGFDTVDANTRLGFAVDARDFGVAARMLNLLNIPALRLLTNNPDKVAGLADEGIEVLERVPHSLPTNPHNAAYLATKRDRTGHKL